MSRPGTVVHRVSRTAPPSRVLVPGIEALDVSSFVGALAGLRKRTAKAVPAVYLKVKKAKALDRLVAEGLQEHTHGRARKIDSLADLE